MVTGGATGRAVSGGTATGGKVTGSTATGGPGIGGGAAPLLATDDVELLDDLLRLSAAAQIRPEIAMSLSAVRTRWSSSPLVVVGADMAEQIQSAHVPRRSSVVLASRAPAAQSLWQRGVELGVEHVACLPEAERSLIDRFAELFDAEVRNAPVIAVVGSRGGSGASSLVAALAVTAASIGLRSRIVDLDSLGAGMDVVLGGEELAGLHWRDLEQAQGRIPAAVLDAGLPELAGTRALTWGPGRCDPLWPGAVAASIDALRRVSDLVIVDLPRGLGDFAGEALARASWVLMVVPRDVTSVAAAGRILSAPSLEGAAVQLVTRGPAPSGIDPEDIAKLLGLPLLANLDRDSAVARELESGSPPGTRRRSSLHRTSRVILDQLGLLGGVTQ
ncbi:MAG: septum site-determining protein Ssd [Candidatus Nanopelagicales bacterium]